MKYTVSIEIALPRDRVMELLANEENFPKWLRGLAHHEQLTGALGEVGATSRFVFQMGKQKMEVVETVKRAEPPEFREVEITGKGMWSVVRDRFTETGPETTTWVSENEFRFSGFVMRLVGLLMPSAFRKQSLRHMQDFKAFAEQGTDVRDAA